MHVYAAAMTMDKKLAFFCIKQETLGIAYFGQLDKYLT